MNCKEVLESRKADKLMLAMHEETESLHKNKIWAWVDKPKNVKLIGPKWIFKIKECIPGIRNPRYKTRLIGKGFTQRERIDYNGIFSHVARNSSIRLILSATAYYDMHLEHFEVKIAFLHGELEEKSYMQLPEIF